MFDPLGGDEPQGENLVRSHLHRRRAVIDGEVGLVFFQQVRVAGARQRKVGAKRHRTATALRFIAAHDQAVAVFGTLDRFDHDVGLLEGDQRGGPAVAIRAVGRDGACIQAISGSLSA